MKRTLLRQLPRARYSALIAGALLSGCQAAVLHVALPEPDRLVLVDEPPGLPAPVPPLPLGPGKTAAAQDRLAQPTVAPTPSDSTPSAAPEKSVTPADSKQLLAEAATRLDAEDLDSAAVYLQRYLRHHPNATIIRLQLAELYYRQQRWDPARHHFATALETANDTGALPVRYLLHGHSRLFDIAGEQGDAFAESLHRGIGLVLLAEKRQDDAGQPLEVPAATLFAKARAALQSASKARPADARPQLYLVPTWCGLQQFSNARLALARAQSLASLTTLTPGEAARLARYGVELPRHAIR